MESVTKTKDGYFIDGSRTGDKVIELDDGLTNVTLCSHDGFIKLKFYILDKESPLLDSLEIPKFFIMRHNHNFFIYYHLCHIQVHNGPYNKFNMYIMNHPKNKESLNVIVSNNDKIYQIEANLDSLND